MDMEGESTFRNWRMHTVLVGSLSRLRTMILVKARTLSTGRLVSFISPCTLAMTVPGLGICGYLWVRSRFRVCNYTFNSFHSTWSFDAYPQRYDCINPDTWNPVGENYHDFHLGAPDSSTRVPSVHNTALDTNPSQPLYLPEVQFNILIHPSAHSSLILKVSRRISERLGTRVC